MVAGVGHFLVACDGWGGQDGLDLGCGRLVICRGTIVLIESPALLAD